MDGQAVGGCNFMECLMVDSVDHPNCPKTEDLWYPVSGPKWSKLRNIVTKSLHTLISSFRIQARTPRIHLNLEMHTYYIYIYPSVNQRNNWNSWYTNAKMHLYVCKYIHIYIYIHAGFWNPTVKGPEPFTTKKTCEKKCSKLDANSMDSKWRL